MWLKIKNMSKNEIEIGQTGTIKDIFENILDSNKRYQEGQELQILTPHQMLGGLPISLTQLKQEIILKTHKWDKKVTIFFVTLKRVNQNRQMSPTTFCEFTDKLNLKNPDKNIALANLSIYYMWKSIKFAYNNNKFKISAPSWNDEFYLLAGSYTILDIKDYFKYITKNEIIADNLPMQIYINKIKNRVEI